MLCTVCLLHCLQKAMKKLTLGVDIGTTSIKVLLLETCSDTQRKIISSKAARHDADISNPSKLSFMEQDVEKICRSLQTCMEEMNLEVGNECMANVTRICFCGQMHGCMLWNSTKRDSSIYFKASTLITWRDQRCNPRFLAKIPKPSNSIQLSTGFGCVTFFWLKENTQEIFLDYNCAGTVMDYIASSLCCLSSPKMSTQNAMSWGYYDFCERKWNLRILQENDFPILFLPKIVEPGTKIGELAYGWHGISSGTEVVVPLGDMQCSVLSCDPLLSDGVFNLSTSAQFSMVAPLKMGEDDYLKTDAYNRDEKPQSAVCVPYFGNQCLYTAASLNGGATFELFANSLLTWTKLFSPSVTLEDVYERLCHSDDNEVETKMAVHPTVFGERHAPDVLASVSNIGPEDMDILLYSRQIANGIVKNVIDMFDCETTSVSPRDLTRILGCGTAFNKNKLFRSALGKMFPHIEVVFDKTMDAAYGAALSAAIY